MKLNKKSLIILIILGLFLFGSGVLAATYFSAKEVSFSPNDSSWDVSNVQDAIDDLYNLAENSASITDYYSSVGSNTGGKTGTVANASVTVEEAGTYYIAVTAGARWSGSGSGIAGFSSYNITVDDVNIRSSSSISGYTIKDSITYDLSANSTVTFSATSASSYDPVSSLHPVCGLVVLKIS